MAFSPTGPKTHSTSIVPDTREGGVQEGNRFSKETISQMERVYTWPHSARDRGHCWVDISHNLARPAPSPLGVGHNQYIFNSDFVTNVIGGGDRLQLSLCLSDTCLPRVWKYQHFGYSSATSDLFSFFSSSWVLPVYNSLIFTFLYHFVHVFKTTWRLGSWYTSK